MNPDTKVKETIHISRHWDSPAILVAVHREGIAIDIKIEDFCKAIVAELSHPAWIFKRGTLEQKVLDAITPVLNKVKEASAHV